VVVRSLNVIFGGISMIHTFEQTIHTLICVGIVGLAVMIFSALASLYFSYKRNRNEV